MAYVKISDLAPEFGKISNPREGFVKGKKGEWRFVPFELMDVAGLVEGASQGKGLGNEFLNDLAGADAFIQVLDMSGETDQEGKPVQSYYPGRDLEIIERELDLWYLGILMKVWKTFSRTVEMQKKNFAESVSMQFSGLKVTGDDVKSVILKGNFDVEKPSAWNESELFRFASFLRKSTKPMIIVANKMDKKNSLENFERIKKEFSYQIIPCFSDAELALKEADKAGLIDYVPGEKNFEIKKELNEKQKLALESIRKFLDEYGNTGVQDVLNKIVLDILGYIAIFPAGEKLEDSKGNVLPDCYLMPPRSTALDFAFRLHSDIGNNFVKAIDVRTKRAVGKEHVMKHRDGYEIKIK